MNEVKTVGTALKNTALVILGGLAVIVAALGFSTATATADRLECNSTVTIVDRGDGTYRCRGHDSTVHAYPQGDAPTGAHQGIVRDRPVGVAGGAHAETRQSDIAVVTTFANKWEPPAWGDNSKYAETVGKFSRAHSPNER